MGRADDKDKDSKSQGAPSAGANPLLPPGLYNLGNSCFFNSVFQSLVATRTIERLVHDPAHNPDASRSPALASHQGDPDRRLPITSTFLRAAENAWAAQDKRLRQPLSLRELLMRLGHKYDQYLDFRQQDAHELLRHLLDAISSEESDIIREANPRPKKRRRTSADPDEDAAGPASFIDIVFGGTLASVLVCADCKHVSVNYEPFNDLSLSLRTEPGRERKRDKFASFANKIQHMQGFRKATSVKRKRPRSVPPPASAPAAAVSDANLERRGSTSETLGVGLPGGSSSDTGGGGLGRLLRWGKPKKSGDPLARPGTPRTLSARSSIELIGSRPTSPARSPSVSPAPSPAPSAPPSPRLPTATLGPEDLPTPRPMRTHFAPRSKAELDDVYLRRILADPQIPKDENDKDRDKDKDKEAETLLDALRAFTAVERLEGENMIGCRRCWKKQHGVPCDDDASSSSSDESESEDSAPSPPRPALPVRASSIHHKASASVTSLPSLRVAQPDQADDADTSDLESEREPDTAGLTGSVASLPVRPSFVRSASVVDMTRAGLPLSGVPDNPYRGPIPSIETTAPDVDGLPAGQGSRHRRERAVGGREPSSAGTSIKGIEMSPAHAPAPEPASSPASSVASLVPSSTTAPAATSPASSTTSLSPTTATPLPRPSPNSRAKTKDPSGVPRSKQIVLRPTLKRYLVARAPQVLVLHLKRFQQVQSTPLINFSSPFKKSGGSGGGGGGFTGQFNTGAKLFGLPGGSDGGLPGGSDLWGAAGGYGSGSGWGSVGGGNGTSFRKVDEWIEFPETLDLAPFVAPRRADLREGRGAKGGRMDYRLYAVVVHIGNMLGGHYVAYTALPSETERKVPASAAGTPNGKADPPAVSTETASVSSGATASTAASAASAPSAPAPAAAPAPPPPPPPPPRQWCFISDQHVRLCSLDEVLRAKAYICFYERVAA
ncbi:peptidase C19, ubiquitin carboxyl-terminal hydrolase 2 [Auricularia subglabra TFB-10046 SS5]|nr:peptidase C19, ubiquitin carboxyl-terminal hydrolase 2 [Auricularia subglabra TFB-10046 SS5]